MGGVRVLRREHLSHPACLIPIVRKQLSYWGTRANYVQLDEALSRAGCPQFARRVRRTLSQIARMP
ncbi:hypothetical protein PGAAJM_00115 [Kocuria varians]